jgi:F-type H+-transporting ATPase subunit alpha
MLDRGARIVELFKQIQYNPLATEIMVTTLWSMQNGFLDDVPVDKIKDFQLKLQDYFGARKDAVLAKIRDKGAIDDEIAGDLKSALGDFKASYV